MSVSDACLVCWEEFLCLSLMVRCIQVENKLIARDFSHMMIHRHALGLRLQFSFTQKENVIKCHKHNVHTT